MDLATREHLLSVHGSNGRRIQGDATTAFRRAAGALRSASEQGDRSAARRAATQAAASIVAMALDHPVHEVAAALSPDPDDREVTWTVACYQVGDLTPSALRDFADPAEAVATLGACPDRAHVAAELVASTRDGIRWTAMTRTHEQLSFQLPTADTATDASGGHQSDLAAALARWDARLAEWAAGRVDAPVPASVVVDTSPTAAPAVPVIDDRRLERLADDVVSRVAAVVRQQVPSVPGPATAPRIAADRAVTARLDALGARLDAVESALMCAITELTAAVRAADARVEAALLALHEEVVAGRVVTEATRDELRDRIDAATATARAAVVERVDHAATATTEALQAEVGTAVRALYRALREDLADARDDDLAELDARAGRILASVESSAATGRADVAELRRDLDELLRVHGLLVGPSVA